MIDAYDAGLYIIDSPRPDRCDPSGYDPAFRAITEAQKATRKPAFPVASMAESFGETRVQAMMEDGVCALLGLETALAAIKAPHRPRPETLAGAFICPRGASRTLSEAEGKALLAEAGIPVPARPGATLAEAAAKVGFPAPYVLKGLGFAHKTEAGRCALVSPRWTASPK